VSASRPSIDCDGSTESQVIADLRDNPFLRLPRSARGGRLTLESALWQLEAEHAEEGGTMQVEPDGRRIPELAGDDGRVKGGKLVEAHHGRDLEAGARAGRDRRHVRPRAGHGGDEAYHQVGAVLVVARDDEGRAPLVAGEIGEREAALS